jgi:hypothetical protein
MFSLTQAFSNLFKQVLPVRAESTHAVFYFPQDFTRRGMQGTHFLAIPFDADSPLLWCVFGVEDDAPYELGNLASEVERGDSNINMVTFSEGAVGKHEDLVCKKAKSYLNNIVEERDKTLLMLDGGIIGDFIGNFSLKGS